MNAIVIRDASELVTSIETARALLDAGDVERALKLSSVAYDQAKAVAGSAERVKTSRDLVDKARRMQAEALKIESLCYVAMADAVDDAQAKGQIARPGRPSNIPGENVFTLQDVGLDAKHLHEARKLRDHVRDEPNFVERVIEVRMSEGLEPSRAALKKAARHATGTKTATKEDRGHDLYETPIEAMRALLALESFSLNVVEPSVGKGAILRPLEDAGYEVTISDLVDREITTRHGECQGVGDFLTSIAAEGGCDIVTNPPYGVANAYVAHALRAHKPRKMAMLLNLNFLCGFDNADRCFVMDECPPSRVYVFTRRLPMMHRDGWEGDKASSQMNTAWFIWERNDDGSYGVGHPQLIRVDWKAYETAAPLMPGAGGFVSPLRFDAPDDEFTRITPRKTLEERCDEETARALVWMAENPGFDAARLRRGIGVRPSVADALIADLAARDLIWAGHGDDGWQISPAGMTGLNATAAVLLGATLDEVAA